MPTHNPAPHSDLPVSGTETEPFNLDQEMNAFVNAARDGLSDLAEEAQDAIYTEFARLESALRVAEQDAARYRFLRNSASWRAEYARGTHGDVMERWIDQALPSAVRCSFCGGGDRLVSGEHRGRVYICGGCAALCVEIFADDAAWSAEKGHRAGAPVPAVDPSWSTPDAVAPTVASRSPQSETRDETPTG